MSSQPTTATSASPPSAPRLNPFTLAPFTPQMLALLDGQLFGAARALVQRGGYTATAGPAGALADRPWWAANVSSWVDLPGSIPEPGKRTACAAKCGYLGSPGLTRSVKVHIDSTTPYELNYRMEVRKACMPWNVPAPPTPAPCEPHHGPKPSRLLSL